jgi:hypothetical protein
MVAGGRGGGGQGAGFDGLNWLELWPQIIPRPPPGQTLLQIPAPVTVFHVFVGRGGYDKHRIPSTI